MSVIAHMSIWELAGWSVVLWALLGAALVRGGVWADRARERRAARPARPHRRRARRSHRPVAGVVLTAAVLARSFRIGGR